MVHPSLGFKLCGFLYSSRCVALSCSLQRPCAGRTVDQARDIIIPLGLFSSPMQNPGHPPASAIAYSSRSLSMWLPNPPCFQGTAPSSREDS